MFHSFDANRISEALRRTIKQSTAATLTFGTPIVVIALTADVVNVDVVKSDVVLKMDENI